MKVPTWLTRLLCSHDWGTSAKLCENGMPESFSLSIVVIETKGPDKPSVERIIKSYVMKMRCIKCGKTRTKELTPVDTEQLCSYAEYMLKDVTGRIFSRESTDSG